jgi:D-alanyl-D-alanine carboxypeptidase (penicillin-binding protein 5/6)
MPNKQRFLAFVFQLALLFSPLSGSAYDSDIPENARSSIPPPKLSVTSWLLTDVSTGMTIAAEKADKRVEPASLTKLMTAYLVFREISRGNVKLDEEVVVSEKAWQTGGSRMFIEPGDRVRVEDLLLGLIVQSGNDSAVALAEHLAGSETGFADLMNQAGIEMGLTNTHFVNSTGLPHPDHFTSARDLNRLTRAIIQQQPAHYANYAIPAFTWNGITQKNRNPLLARDESVDGVKTGYTKSAGYCLIGSAKRNRTRLIATVIGAGGERERANLVYALLKYGFAAYESHHLYGDGSAIVTVEIFKGRADSVSAGISEGIDLLLAKGLGEELEAKVQLVEPLVAPIDEGGEVGTLTLRLKGEPLLSRPLVALESVPAGSWFGGLADSVRLWLR